MALLSVLLLTGVVFLQIFFSKKDNKWLGLILPAITLIISIMATLGLILYTPVATLTEQGYKTILNTVQIPKVATIFKMFYIFFIYNIPTAILLGVYFACRGKLKRTREIEKMSVQDLE
ncbi:hypothetical protein E1757_06580 [Paenibacillus piri]|uniref:Uncharacterized protein n=2 Tax=Paenibacillus piri TaxID=2547395 RepID=A0A4R5KV53_9BACL|nr:hypothetical protein E1757_06580 [Paenibacillus piri]